MKTSFLSSILILILLISGGGYSVYGKGTLKNQDAGVTVHDLFLKKLEKLFVKEKPTSDKLNLGSLSVYQDTLVKEIEKQHPYYTKIINLGKTSYSLTDCPNTEKGAPKTSSKHYLLEVQEENAFFYYGVSVVTSFRAPSDVIPAHVSKVSIFIKRLEKEKLLELQKS